MYKTEISKYKTVDEVAGTHDRCSVRGRLRCSPAQDAWPAPRGCSTPRSASLGSSATTF
jgi:hypothetical protein